MSAFGPLRQFAATQQFGRFRSEADIQRAALAATSSAKVTDCDGMNSEIISLNLVLSSAARSFICSPFLNLIEIIIDAGELHVWRPIPIRAFDEKGAHSGYSGSAESHTAFLKAKTPPALIQASKSLR
jgi:hypothetical protein